MTNGNNDQDRVDRLENAFITLAETQREQTAAIQRHDMLLEMAHVIQREHTEYIHRHEETQNQMITLMHQQNTMMHNIIATQQAQAETQRLQGETQQAQAETQRLQAEIQRAQGGAIQSIAAILQLLMENRDNAQ